MKEFSLFQESVFFPLMILSILFKQKYPILFVALNFADIALIVFLLQARCYNKAGGLRRKRACPALETGGIWLFIGFLPWRKERET